MLRWLTAGESHGRALVAICEGLPAGIEVTTADIAAALARRRAGYGRGARMKFEQDEVEITGGVRHGRTLGAPVAIRIANTEWPKWETVMSPDPVTAEVLADQARAAPLTRPRPGHADLAGMQKYGYEDARPVLERASARETAARVALGELARSYLRQSLSIEIVSHVVAIGHVCAPDGAGPGPGDGARVDADPVRCLDPAAGEAMRAEIDAARMDGDTLGGVVEVIAYGVPPGLGSHVHWDRRLDARLAGALMSIQAMKGVEVGDGFATARRRGSQAHDEIEAGQGGDPAAHEPGRRGGGRYEHRRAAAGAGGDEADLDRAPGPGHRGRRHRRGGEGDQPAQRRDRRARGRGGGRGHDGAGAGRCRHRKVRRRLGAGDPAEPARLPGIAGDRMTGPVAILIGPPGAGKTTVGRLLAGLLEAEFLDTDDVVEEAAGKPVSDIFISDGEAVFRGLEREAVAHTVASHRGILALGGGAVMDPGTRQLLAGQRVVYLETGFAAAAHRTGLDAPRPLLIGNPRTRMRELLAERLPVYKGLAWATVSTDDRAPQEVADEIAATITARIAAETGEGAGTAPEGPPEPPQ